MCPGLRFLAFGLEDSAESVRPVGELARISHIAIMTPRYPGPFDSIRAHRLTRAHELQEPRARKQARRIILRELRANPQQHADCDRCLHAVLLAASHNTSSARTRHAAALTLYTFGDSIRERGDRCARGSLRKLADLHAHFLTGDPSWYTQTIEPSLVGASEVRRVFLAAL